jgi:hypothetical protein
MPAIGRCRLSRHKRRERDGSDELGTWESVNGRKLAEMGDDESGRLEPARNLT